MPGELVLKVELDADLRRFRIQQGPDHAATWGILYEAVRSGFELGERCDLVLKYKDEEGDLCTLARATLPDCIDQAGSGPLRLFASRATAADMLPPKAGNAFVATKKEELIAEGPVAPQQCSVRPPPGICDEDAMAEDSKNGHGTGYRGVGPWKLLICLGSLRASGKLSAAMIASIMLQFLPILAQRAHRKQEKLNRVGSQYRDTLVPLFHRVSLQLDEIEDGPGVKAGIDEFVTGKETARLGDTVAQLLKILAASKLRASVARLLKSASEELLDILPRLFPDSFNEFCPPVAEHVGARCAACDANPLLGPRFHSVDDGLDFCGECFIDSAFEASSKFECHLASDPGADTWKEGWKVWKEGVCHWKKAWMAFKGGGMKGCKGKGKGKGKGKSGKGKDGEWHGWSGWGGDLGAGHMMPWMAWGAGDPWYYPGMAGAESSCDWYNSTAPAPEQARGNAGVPEPSAPHADEI